MAFACSSYNGGPFGSKSVGARSGFIILGKVIVIGLGNNVIRRANVNVYILSTQTWVKRSGVVLFSICSSGGGALHL